MSKRYRLAAWLLTAALVLCACAGPEPETAPSTGNIRLYGETHGQQDLLDRELELWRTHYGEGGRHLFVELAYYEAQLLNRWMEAEDDALLDHLFQALEDREVEVRHSGYNSLHRAARDYFRHNGERLGCTSRTLEELLALVR